MKHWFAKIKILARSKRNQKIAIIVLAGFVALNLLTGIIYHSRTLPRTQIGAKNLPSTQFTDLDSKLGHYKLLPSKIKLYYKDKSVVYKSGDLGLSLDTKKIITASQDRSLLPVLNLASTQYLPVVIKVNEAKFNKAFQSIATTFKSEPINAEIIISQGLFTIKPEANGYKINKADLKRQLTGGQKISKEGIKLQVQRISPSIKQAKLKPAQETLRKQQQTPVTFHYQTKVKKLTPDEISGLYAKSAETYVLSDQLIKSKIASLGTNFGIKLQNGSEAASALKDSLSKNEALDFTFVPLIQSRTFTYCVQLRGVDASNQAAFEAKLNSTYADQRGWSLGGQVRFVRAGTSCNFTAWLAAADQVPSFGSICDTAWSCTVSPNVIINFDRWTNASPSWNSAGGSLDDYRSMVINHETGHWLGFGHKYCSGAGQAAPVMQQQSIDLQGCKFNPWPLETETSALRSWLGI